MHVATSLLAVLACSTGSGAEPEPGTGLVAGYPGYKQQKWKMAPRRAQARSLFYRETPKVDNLQSSVHELYMRPYNYVSYEMGGSAGGSQYKYQYQTHHPQFPAYKTTNTYENPKPTYHKTPTLTYQSPAPTPVYHTTPAPTYHKPSPTYPSPTPAPYYHQPSPTYSPTYHYQPYTYQTTPVPAQPPAAPAYQRHSAVAVLSGESGVSGLIRFQQTGGPPSPVSVSGNVTGLSAGPHGFHIHQLGDTSGGCKSTGGHFNPLQLRHGAPGDLYRHVGDLGNILAGEDGVAVVNLEDTQLSLTGLASIVGRGVVVHAGMDDLGRGGDDGSLKTGNAGGRVACGVIGLAGTQ